MPKKEVNTIREKSKHVAYFLTTAPSLHSKIIYIQQCIESYGVVSHCIAANSFIHLLYHPCKSLCIFPTIPPQTTLLPSTSHTPLSPPPHSTTSHLITLRRRMWRSNRRSPRLAVWARWLLCEAEYYTPHSSHRVFGRTGERGIGSGL
jgi:hypothetical protein